MDPSEIFRVIAEGAVYDIFKWFVGPVIITTALTSVLRVVFKKLHGFREFGVFIVCTYLAICTLFYFVGADRARPQLIAGIQNAIVAPTPDQKSTLVIVTMSVMNTGGMQTITKNWSVEASLNGVKYQGMFAPMPDKVIMQMPDVGQSSPLQMTYRKEDDMLIKSISPLQGGALVPGTLYVVFENLEVSIFKNGVDITVNFEDIFSKKYAATIKTTAKNAIVGIMPGLHTEMVCRMPSNGPLPDRPAISPWPTSPQSAPPATQVPPGKG